MIRLEELTAMEIHRLVVSMIRRGRTNDTVEKLIESLAIRAEKCERTSGAGNP
jgi:hypothetical protein